MIHEKELHHASSLYDTGITKLLKEQIYLSSVWWSLVVDLRIEILYKKTYLYFWNALQISEGCPWKLVPLHFSSVCWSLVWDLRIEILLKNNYLIFLKRVSDIRRLSMTMGYCTSLQWMVYI